LRAKYIRAWFDVGYFRPIQQWNKGKQTEWEEKIFLKNFMKDLKKEVNK